MNDQIKICDDQSRPLLSIITPCLNSFNTLRDTLNSVADVAAELGEQGYQLEHLLVDGGSVDGTLDLISEYLASHRYCRLVSPVTGGPYAAMNRGLELAQGTYIHVLNSDDYIAHSSSYCRLMYQADLLNASVLLTSVAYFRRPLSCVEAVWCVQPLPRNRSTWKKQLKLGLHYPHPGFIAHHHFYRLAGFDPAFRLAADYKLMQSVLLGLADTDSVLVEPQPLIAMAKGGLTGRWASMLRGYVELRKINHELGIHAPLFMRYLRKLMKRILLPWFERLG